MEPFHLFPKPEKPDITWYKYSHYTPDNIHNGATINGSQFKLLRENLIFQIWSINPEKYHHKICGKDRLVESFLLDRKMYWAVYNDMVRSVLCKCGNWLFQEDLEADLPIKKTSNTQHEFPKDKIKQY